MGRWIFAAVLGLVALLYAWLAIMALFSNGGFLHSDDVTGEIVGLFVFVVMGVAAGIGSVSLLRQKGNR